MKEWKKVKFLDFIVLQRGFDLTKESIKEGLYPVVCSTSIMGYHNDYKVKGPGVVTGRSGTLGETQFVRENFWPHNTTLYVKDFKGNDRHFVYYFMKNFDIASMGGGAAIPSLNRNVLSNITVSIPDISTQQRIATILSRYDSLIENYQKQIKLLEESAQRLYKEWFIDLRFPGHENTKIVDGVPEGWEKGILDNIAYESGKKVDKKYRENYGCYLPIDCLPKKNLTYVEYASILLAESSLVSFKKGDIIFGAMRPYFHKVCFSQSEGLTRTTCFVLNSRLHEYREYLLMLMFEDSTVKHATSISVGTTMPYTRWKDLKSMEILIPDKKTVVLFGKEIYKITEALQNFSSQIRHATEARDRLLPKLMSGEFNICIND